MVEEGRTAGIAVTALAGVPVGYLFGGEDIPYSQSCPPEQVAADGICPGCASEQGAGAPPVRVAALVDAFRPDDDRTIASICGGDPTPLWAPLAETLLGKIAVMCVEACAADADPATAALEPTCEVVEALPGEQPKPVRGRSTARACRSAARPPTGPTSTARAADPHSTAQPSLAATA